MLLATALQGPRELRGSLGLVRVGQGGGELTVVWVLVFYAVGVGVDGHGSIHCIYRNVGSTSLLRVRPRVWSRVRLHDIK